jgi:PIN domain nuclease of toxin-antitoxin system
MARTRSLTPASGLVFLDTHVAVWMYAGAIDELSQTQRRAIEVNTVCVSPIVTLELDFLREIGRLRVGGDAILSSLSRDLDAIVKRDNLDDVVRAAQGMSWTRDPFDRLIAAHTLLCKGLLVTADMSVRAHFKHCV